MRAEKQFLVDEVAAQLAASNYLLLANFTGVTVENATKVREQLRAHGAEYHVVKNSILNIAVKDAKLLELTKALAESAIVEKSLHVLNRKFVNIRYGNVLNSRGSIIPILHEKGPELLSTATSSNPAPNYTFLVHLPNQAFG